MKYGMRNCLFSAIRKFKLSTILSVFQIRSRQTDNLFISVTKPQPDDAALRFGYYAVRVY